jgi:hypothetical protein
MTLPVFGKILAGPEKFSSGKERKTQLKIAKNPPLRPEMKVFQWPSQYFSRASIFPKTAGSGRLEEISKIGVNFLKFLLPIAYFRTLPTIHN